MPELWIKKTFLGTLVLLLLAGNYLIGARLYSAEVSQNDQDEAFEYIGLFTRAVEQIRQHYVDAEKTSYKDLIYGAMRGMIQTLDAHSQFMDPDMFSDMQEDTSGHFGGLGVVISIRDGLLTIVSPMEGTPGFEAGLMAGDRIVEIEGESTEGTGLSEAVKKLRGEPGSDVTIKVLREGLTDLLEVTITRAVINVPSVKDTQVLDGGIGYIRITQFNTPTAERLEEALDDLDEQGFRALILDLRNNPGGLLKSAVEVSEKFLKRRSLIVYTQTRSGKRDDQYYASDGAHQHFPMVVLVNGGSASASEIVAGALKDHQRAVLVGERTFGKGSVQSVLPADDGSALRLTTAKYYTPSEKVIHEKGIEPDIVVAMPPEAWRSIMEERAKPDGRQSAMSDADVQLQHAVDVLKGIMIFQADVDTSSRHRLAHKNKAAPRRVE